MHNYEICCVGHLTLDKVVTPKETVYMSGGASFYFSHAVSKLNSDYILVTGLAESELKAVEILRAKGIKVEVMLCQNSVYFENTYGENQDNRTQRVLAKADPFIIEAMGNIHASYFHVGALLADDFSNEFVEELSKRGKISIDCQGYLREVRGDKVFPVDWADKLEVLKYVDVLKANELEMKVLTGTTDVYKAARLLNSWGVKEVLLTLGSMGSVIYDGQTFTMIPAYQANVVDATGCGDTYMAGYLYKRAKGASMEDAAKFAAAMATIKIEAFGPFTGTEEDVLAAMNSRAAKIPTDEILASLVI
ncbi:PfkB family carbohydrate kinase [Dysgonomonas macrotermitis]|uniref:Sugar or nucleoside kinase, ribokinase family n=1 Tax=Dysgonomonas macrotermitis TaxID=1346286 RepID=A0A1M5FJF2_9BACT|nr:PfkB family carbohydrate kinase [Dysgonomonas macrotermitis]SHF91615.1 Sugar or nucleoside kinase, ribokinase family [Dysgonomonas macrotermitis]